jgi:hypothetical protein
MNRVGTISDLKPLAPFYAGVESETRTTTAYKWSFASKSSRADRDALQAAKDEIHSANYGSSGTTRRGTSSGEASRRIGPTMGPALPTSADITLARESAAEFAAVDRKNERKRQRAEERDRVEDMVGPKPVGREGQLEAKRARRESDKAFRERGEDGFQEADEGTLMGGGDDFRAAYVVNLCSPRCFWFLTMNTVLRVATRVVDDSKKRRTHRGWTT